MTRYKIKNNKKKKEKNEKNHTKWSLLKKKSLDLNEWPITSNKWEMIFTDNSTSLNKSTFWIVRTRKSLKLIALKGSQWNQALYCCFLSSTLFVVVGFCFWLCSDWILCVHYLNEGLFAFHRTSLCCFISLPLLFIQKVSKRPRQWLQITMTQYTLLQSAKNVIPHLLNIYFSSWMNFRL